MERESGLTQLGLAATIGILAILSSFAFPPLGSLIADNELDTAQENIVSMIRKARSMAISRNTTAIVSIDSTNRIVRISAADNSFPAETVTLRPRISIASDATLNFGTQGTMRISLGNGTITLSSPAYTSLSTRTIDIRPIGNADPRP